MGSRMANFGNFQLFQNLEAVSGFVICTFRGIAGGILECGRDEFPKPSENHQTPDDEDHRV
jgi:hypothetical protein